MAESLGRAVLELTTDDRGLSQGLNKAQRQAQGLDRQFSRSMQGVERSTQRAGSQFSNVFSGLDRVVSRFTGVSMAGLSRSVQNFVDVPLRAMQTGLGRLTGVQLPAMQSGVQAASASAATLAASTAAVGVAATTSGASLAAAAGAGAVLSKSLIGAGRDAFAAQQGFKGVGSALMAMRRANSSAAESLGITLEAFRRLPRQAQAAARAKLVYARALDTVSASATRSTRAVAGFGAALRGPVGIVAAATGGLFLLANSGAKAADELGKMSERTGLAIDTLRALQEITSLNDASIQDLSNGVRNMQRLMADAARGTGEANIALRALGFTTQELLRASSDPEGTLVLLAQRLMRVTNAADRNRAAGEILGRTIGEKLIPTMGELARGALPRAREQLGRTSEEMAESTRQAQIFRGHIERLQNWFVRLRDYIADRLIPIFNRLFEAMTKPQVAGLRMQRAILEGLRQATAGPFGISEMLIDLLPSEAIRSRFKEATEGIKEDIDAAIKVIDAKISELAPEVDLTTSGPPIDYAANEAAIRKSMEGQSEAGKQRQKELEDAIQRNIAKVNALGEAERERLGKALDIAAQLETEQQAYSRQVAEAIALQEEFSSVLSQEDLSRHIENLSNAMWENSDAGRAWAEALEEGLRLTEDLRTPTEVYIDTLGRLDELLIDSHISLETYSRGLEKAAEDFRTASKEANNFDSLFDQLGFTFQSTAEDAIISGAKISDVLDALVEDVARLALRLLILKPLIDSIGNAFSSWMMPMPNVGAGASPGIGMMEPVDASGIGFQRGGRFKVGGSGGSDSQLVAFRASPMEEVIVNPPGKSSSGEVTVNVHNYGNSQVTTQSQRNSQGGMDIMVMIDQAVAQNLANPGSQTSLMMRNKSGVRGLTHSR